MSQVATAEDLRFSFSSHDKLMDHVSKLDEVDVDSPTNGVIITPQGKLVIENNEFDTSPIFLRDVAKYVGYPEKLFMSPLSGKQIASSITELLSYTTSSCSVRVVDGIALSFNEYTNRRRVPSFIKDFFESLNRLNALDENKDHVDNEFTFRNGLARADIVQHRQIEGTGSGDPSRVDLRMQAGYSRWFRSMLGGLRLKRFSCDNSTVLSYGNRRSAYHESPDMTLAAFHDTLPGLSMLQDRLPEAYSTMVHQGLDEKSFKELKEMINKSMGIRMADAVMSSYYKTGKNKDGKECMVVDLAEVRQKTAYDIFNDVTWNAKQLNLGGSINEQASSAAGEILKLYIDKTIV